MGRRLLFAATSRGLMRGYQVGMLDAKAASCAMDQCLAGRAIDGDYRGVPGIHARIRTVTNGFAS